MSSADQTQQQQQQPANGNGTAVAETKQFPAAKYRTLPYGEHQGSFRGVVACSNRDDGFFSGEKTYVDHLIHTGFRYQCVEYARRFLLLTTGCVFGECGRASEIYNMEGIADVETGKKYAFVHNDNGKSTQKPQPGDVIIYPFDDKLCPWGHVGVISYVDEERVGIAEQNQYFGSFISPSPDYLDGERCVGRFVDLVHNADGSWTIQENASMPSPKGWLSYPGTPTRESVYAPFKPLPEFIAVRSTPVDDPRHPFVHHIGLPEPIILPTGGTLSEAFGLASGTGQSLVGACTATGRVLRYTLQALFRHGHIGEAFLSLPTNPLKADVAPDARLDALFGEMVRLGMTDGNERDLVPALSRYFELPERWLYAMQQEFAKGELHVLFTPIFDLKVAEEDAAMAREGLERDAASGQPRPRAIRCANPHDAMWQLCKLDASPLRVMVEAPQVAAVFPRVKTAVEFQIENVRCFGTFGYSYDFRTYLKTVEERRGPRTAFTIVLDSPERMDGPKRELVTTLQSYCEKVKYPVRVVAETDLHYDEATGKLHARITDDSPPIASPTTVHPTGDYEVNFVFHLCEWAEILRGSGDNADGHAALYHAATHHERSDVVFAKPLWSYLVDGLTNHHVDADVVGDTAAGAATPLSVRFFDVTRRFYAYATPRQAAETWDQEVSEFKDSCRRIGIAGAVPHTPTAGFAGVAVMVNFAYSAATSYTMQRLEEGRMDKPTTGAQPGASFHAFPADAE